MPRNKIAASIDIGSNVVRMHISQWDGQKVVTLDRMEKPIQLGKEVFSNGYASFGTVSTLSSILCAFCEKAREYGISSVHAIASTALREASNQAYILDHLWTRNKLDVQVLEDTGVSSLIINTVKNSGYTPTDNMLVVNAGTGTTDFELLKNDKVVLAQSIQTGLLKISEMLREASDFSLHVESMAEEYLNTFLMRKTLIQDLWKADGIVFSTGDCRDLYALFAIQAESSVMLSENSAVPIDPQQLLALYQVHRSMSIDQICSKYSLDIQRGGILYSTLTLLVVLLRLTGAKTLFCTQTNLADAQQNLILIPGARKKLNKSLRDGAVTSALDLATRYRCDLHHAKHVAESALFLFNKLKELVGLSKQHEHLLHIACLLHESGNYTDSIEAEESSFDLVCNSYIYGLTHRETMLAANIIAPRTLLGRTRDLRRGDMLDSEDVLLAAKMHAILQVADALDYSHRQKMRRINAGLNEEHLMISVEIQENYTLEQWVFKENADLFQEILGITLSLQTNNIYHPR